MGRGVSAGGGKSSLSYLFGESVDKAQIIKSPQEPVNKETEASHSASKPAIHSQIPAGIQAKPTNNYFRADGQNCGNFVTERPSTKVHAAPGGGSSLGYLFGGSDK